MLKETKQKLVSNDCFFLFFMIDVNLLLFISLFIYYSNRVCVYVYVRVFVWFLNCRRRHHHHHHRILNQNEEEAGNRYCRKCVCKFSLGIFFSFQSAKRTNCKKNHQNQLFLTENRRTKFDLAICTQLEFERAVHVCANVVVVIVIVIRFDFVVVVVIVVAVIDSTLNFDVLCVCVRIFFCMVGKWWLSKEATTKTTNPQQHIAFNALSTEYRCY